MKKLLSFFPTDQTNKVHLIHRHVLTGTMNSTDGILWFIGDRVLGVHSLGHSMRILLIALLVCALAPACVYAGIYDILHSQYCGQWNITERWITWEYPPLHGFHQDHNSFRYMDEEYIKQISTILKACPMVVIVDMDRCYVYLYEDAIGESSEWDCYDSDTEQCKRGSDLLMYDPQMDEKCIEAVKTQRRCRIEKCE